jgi:hypothetical protein
MQDESCVNGRQNNNTEKRSLNFQQRHLDPPGRYHDPLAPPPPDDPPLNPPKLDPPLKPPKPELLLEPLLNPLLEYVLPPTENVAPELRALWITVLP